MKRTIGQYATPGTPRYRRIQLGILLTGLSVFTQLYIFQPLLQELVTHFGIDVATSSLTVSMSTAGLALGLFIYVFYADLLSRKRVMTVSLLTSALITVSTGLCARHFGALLVLCFLKGIALAGVSAVALSYLNEEVSPTTIGYTIALYLAGNSVGGMGGRVMSKLLASWLGWPMALMILGGVTLLIGVLFSMVLPPSQRFSPSNIPIRVRLARMRLYVRTPYFISIYLIAFLGMGVFVSVYNYIGVRLAAPPFSVPKNILAFLYVMFSLGIVSSLILGRLSDRYSSIFLLRCCTGLYLPGLLLLNGSYLWIVIVGLSFVTISFFGIHTLASRLVSTKAGAGRSSATCLYWLFYYLGSSIFGYITGLVYRTWGWWAFVGSNMVGVGVALGLSLIFLQKRYMLGDDFVVPQ